MVDVVEELVETKDCESLLYQLSVLLESCSCETQLMVPGLPESVYKIELCFHELLSRCSPFHKTDKQLREEEERHKEELRRMAKVAERRQQDRQSCERNCLIRFQEIVRQDRRRDLLSW